MARLSRTKKKRLAAVLLSIFVVVAAFIGAMFVSVNQLQSKYDIRLEELTNIISENHRMVYRALMDIPAGTEINSNNTEYVSVFSDMEDFVYMDESDLGKLAAVDIFAGESIRVNMVGDTLASTLRECEYALLTMNNNLKQNDYVDIRIMYPNGENYVVLSKICIQELDLESNAVMFWLQEDEIMDMSSAIVDTYLRSGTILYTTKYIQDNQPALIRNYQPSADCMVAIANDPNIIDEARDAVTERLSATSRAALDSRLDMFAGVDSKSGTSSTGASVDLSNSVRVGSYTGDTVDTESGTTENNAASGSEAGFAFTPDAEAEETAENESEGGVGDGN